ncbi:YafY family protein [Paenibacillus sp. YYML68]|uniref:helix-turn-helix transcriptional regulator n=1 Tax=Paenibacillus sp. YYML68 TaxID=2909250 RepID=UPI0024907495|nr:transcriptional regulator [Paenibacillus sp. YYML68]
MTDKLIRLMRIINLVQGKPGILAKELAERCETTERTIYRDFETLSAMGIPMTNLGHGRGYSFIGNFSMYPMNWTEEEALAFSMLPSVLEQVKPLVPPGFETAYEKVMATHRKEKSRQADVLEQVADIIQMGTPAYREEGSHYLFPIIQATLSQKTIEAAYYTQSRNELSKRLIDPYYLVPRENRFYVIGYCHNAQQVRTFRVSRFRSVEVTEQSFDKADFNLRAYLRNTWSIERGEEQITFKIKFSANAARYVKEEELFVHPKLTELPGGELLFQVTLNHDREFLGWLAQYGPDAEILEPASYRQVMLERLSRWRQMYEGALL